MSADRIARVVDPRRLNEVCLHSQRCPPGERETNGEAELGDFDLDAEMKLAGSGFGIVEVKFAKGSDMMAIAQFVNHRIFANGQ